MIVVVVFFIHMAIIEDFQKLDIRVGKVIEVRIFPNAKNPAFQVWVDFGEEIGIKKSSAQITELYTQEELVGKQVVAVVNFPPRQIGNFMSEVLILGGVGNTGEVTLLMPERVVQNGTKVL